MAKYINTTAIDQALIWVSGNATSVVLLTAEPANRAACTAATALVRHQLATATGVDWQMAAGDTSGRKLTLSSQSTLTPLATGAVAYMAIYSSVNAVNTIYYTTVAAVTITSTADRITIPAHDIEISNAT